MDKDKWNELKNQETQGMYLELMRSIDLINQRVNVIKEIMEEKHKMTQLQIKRLEQKLYRYIRLYGKM